MTEDTKSCYNYVIDNYYLEDDSLKRCHSNCLQCTNNLNKKCKKCQSNLYLTEDKKSCLLNGIDDYYLEDNILKKCHESCSQ